MSDAISDKQFNTERTMLQQGNEDELATRVRGVQHMTSNVFKPSFSGDYTTVRSSRSPASASSGGMEEEENEE